MAAPLYAYDLYRICRNPDYRGPELLEGLARAPLYRRFADAGQHVVRVLHTLPRLWEDSALDEIEVYIGRAGATPDHVYNRWENHLTEKNHDHGVVALRCETSVVDVWETAAVRVLKSLHSRQRLCVRNASASGQGRLPSTDESCIYLTWAVGKPRRKIVLADRTIVDDIAREVAEHTRDLGIQAESLRRAIDPITRPVHERAAVDWHPAHAT